MKKIIVSFFQHLEASICKPFVHFFLSPEVYGTELLKKAIEISRKEKKALVIISNHTNALDPFVIFSLFPGRIRNEIFPVLALGKKELFNNKLKNICMKASGCIPAENITEMKNSFKILKCGEGTIFFFPEGKVSQDGSFGEDQGGVSAFCKHHSFVLLPIKINGLKPFHKDWKNMLQRRRIFEMILGEPEIVKGKEKINAVALIKSISRYRMIDKNVNH